MNGDQQSQETLPATVLEERQALLAHMVRLVARRLSFGLFVAGSGGVGKRPPDPLPGPVTGRFLGGLGDESGQASRTPAVQQNNGHDSAATTSHVCFSTLPWKATGS